MPGSVSRCCWGSARRDLSAVFVFFKSMCDRKVFISAVGEG
jgi:hypothetical protein